MTYTPQIGDYGTVRGSGFVAWCIRTWTRSDAAHVYVVVSETECMEAMPGGAILSLLSKYPDAEYNEGDPVWAEGVAEYDVPEIELRQGVALYALSRRGVKYNWWDILCIGLLQYGIKPRWARNRVQKMDMDICSQQTDDSYYWCWARGKWTPLHLFKDGRLPMDVTPGDLRKRVHAYQAKRRRIAAMRAAIRAGLPLDQA